jgi:hypothetical protein
MTAQITQPRRGRPTELDREARTLAGQVAMIADGRFAGVSTHCMYGDHNHAMRRRHDARTDAAALAMAKIGRQMTHHKSEQVQAWGWAILTQYREYVTADALEDAEAEAAAGHNTRAHDEARIGSGEIEALVSTRARGRAARHATVAVQGTLEMGADDGR